MIQIITDSMSDVRQKEAAKNDLVVLPLTVLFGQDSYLDGLTISCEEFYMKLSQTKQLPKTSQVSPEAFSNAFEKALSEGKSVVYISGSSKLSGTYQSAMLARNMQANPQQIFIVDSLTASLGQQFLIWEAIRLRNLGASAEEITKQLNALVPRINLVGHTSNLKHLVMGGRLNATTARIGTTLNLKPTLRVKDGKIGQESLTRGTKRANQWLIAQLKKIPRDPGFPVYLASSNAHEALMAVRLLLEENGELDRDSREVDIGAIIGTHTGPGILAISWIQAE